MEAVKNRLTSFGGNAWSLIVNPDYDLVVDACHGNLDQPVRRRKADRIVENRVDCARKPGGLSHHHCAALSRPGECDPCIARFPSHVPALDELFDQLAKVHAAEMSA